LGECCRATREYQRGKRSLERGRNKKVRKVQRGEEIKR
jgi:hypothetical protein